MAEIIIPSVLAGQANGQWRFDAKGETIGEALRALPVADLIFDARGEWNRHLNVYVDGEDARERGGLERPLTGIREVRIIAMLAGG